MKHLFLKSLSICLLVANAGFWVQATDAQVKQEWLETDLGSTDATERGTGIGIDHNGSVYLSGTTIDGLNVCTDPTYFPIDIDDCDQFGIAPYSTELNQIVWRLNQADGASGDRPLVLATCNTRLDRDLTPPENQQGSANDIVVNPTNGSFCITGVCDFTSLTTDVGEAVESDAYLRSFESFNDASSTTTEFETSVMPGIALLTGHAIAQYNGATYLVGTQTSNAGNCDIFVYSSGIGETRAIGLASSDEAGNGISVNSSGIYITGTTTGTFGAFPTGEGPCPPQEDSQQDIIVLKLDFELNVVWVRQFNGTAFGGDNIGCEDEIACSIAVNQDNQVYVAGSILNASNGSTGLLLRYNSDGTREWVRRLGGEGTPVENLSANDIIFADVATDLVSGVYVIGTTRGVIDSGVEAGTNEQSLFFARYNDMQDAGQFEWAKQIDNDPFTSSTGLSISIDSRNKPDQLADIYIAGSANHSNSGPSDPPFTNFTNDSDCGFIDGTPLAVGFADFQLLAGRYSQSASFLLGDVDCNGVVNLQDVEPFVELVTSGEFLDKADINGDGVVNLLDVVPFVNILTGG